MQQSRKGSGLRRAVNGYERKHDFHRPSRRARRAYNRPESAGYRSAVNRYLQLIREVASDETLRRAWRAIQSN